MHAHLFHEDICVHVISIVRILLLMAHTKDIMSLLVAYTFSMFFRVHILFFVREASRGAN